MQLFKVRTAAFLLSCCYKKSSRTYFTETIKSFKAMKDLAFFNLSESHSVEQSGRIILYLV